MRSMLNIQPDVTTLSVRNGMQNSETGLSFIVAVPEASGQHSGGSDSDGDDGCCCGRSCFCKTAAVSKRRSKVWDNTASWMLARQGGCCQEMQSSRSLKYRVISDVMCAATILPGSVAVTVIAVGYLSGDPTPDEPFPWLKYVMVGLSCMLLLLCFLWLVTAVCVYRRAFYRRVKGDKSSAARTSAAQVEIRVTEVSSGSSDDCSVGVTV